jgi:hypothetical protein
MTVRPSVQDDFDFEEAEKSNDFRPTFTADKKKKSKFQNYCSFNITTEVGA